MSLGLESHECALARNQSGFSPDVYTPPSKREGGAAVQRGVFVFVVTTMCLFTVIFACFKYLGQRRYSRLQKRHVRHVFVTHLGASLATVTGSWYDTHPIETGIPCWIYFPLYFFIVPCLVFPPAVQLFAFWRRAQLSDASKSLLERTSDGASETSSSPNGLLGRMWGVELIARAAIRMDCYGARRAATTTTTTIPATTSSSAAGDREETTTTRASAGDERMFMVRMRVVKFLQSDLGGVVLLSLLFIPFVLTVAVSMGLNEMVRLGCWGCFPNAVQQIVLIVEGVCAILVIIFAYRMCLGRKDPFGIVQEARICVWLGGAPACLCLILNTVFDDSGDFKFVILLEIFLVLYCSYQSVLQCILAEKDFRAERGAVLLTKISLEEFERDFLSTQGFFHQAFSDHLLSEHAHENLAFILGVRAYEATFFDAGAKTNRVRAKKLIHMYVGDDALLPVNLPDHITRKLLEDFDKDDTVSLDSDFFAPARAEIEILLHRDALSRFVRSDAFIKLQEKRLGTVSPSAVA